MSRIKFLAVEPMMQPYLTEFDDDLIRTYLGGWMEIVQLSETCLLICDEEGKLKGLPRNRRVGDDIICGNFLLCSEKEDEETGELIFTDITNEDAEKYMKQFRLPDPRYDSPFITDDWLRPNSSGYAANYVSYDWYQCNDGVYYTFLKYKPGRGDLKDYHKVYSGIVKKKNTPELTCNNLFERFNLDLKPYNAWSMSVSDVIVLHYPEGDRTMYVDSFGFTEITGQKKTEAEDE